MSSLATLLAAVRRGARQIPHLPAAVIPPDAAAGYDIAAEVAARLEWKPLG